MSIFIFIALMVGILTYKFAEKWQWEERLIRKRKERKIEWVKKQKQGKKPYGNRLKKHNKPPKRKK